MKTTEILNDFKPDKRTAEKPHYTMAMLITCEGTPYQVRQGDIIRHGVPMATGKQDRR